MTIKTNFDMDDDAKLDYPFDWRGLSHGVEGADSDWLGEDEQITDAEITIYPTGELALVQAVTISDGRVEVWLQGGVAGNSYKVSCKITTNNTPVARVDERTIQIHVKER